MRYKEFVTAESIAIMKFTFEKALASLIRTHKKQAKIIRNKQRMAKQKKRNRVNSLKNKTDSAFIINNTPKRL